LDASGFSPLIADRILPFMVKWNAEGELQHVSKALRRFWRIGEHEAVDGIQIWMQRPFSTLFELKWFPELTDMVLLVCSASARDRVLRCELLDMGAEGWLLLGRPNVTRVTDLEDMDLQLSDLPVHMGMGDLLIANEAAQISLKESEKAAAQLRVVNHHLRATNETFSRFVPRPFLDALGLDSPGEAGLGAHVGVSKCVMFADLRSFTALSEQMQAKDIFAFINGFLETIAPSIRDYGGFVVHYLGDGIMALFPEEPDGAIRSAIKMQEALQEWSTHQVPQSNSHLKLGIGLHFGHLELGIVGESGRWDSSVISDAVNTASRVEGLTKVFGANLLVTREVASRIADKDAFSLRRLGRIAVKGRKKLVDLFEVLDALPTARRERIAATIPVFERSLLAFEQGKLEEARIGFSECVQQVPDDLAALYYLNDLKGGPDSEAGGKYVHTRSITPT
jgi:class 3 adenylate cyclase